MIVLNTSAPAGTSKIWTLNLAGPPTVTGDLLSYTTGNNRLDVHRVAPTSLPVEVRNWPELRKGMRGGVRVDAIDAAGTAQHFLHVLGANGAVTSVTRSDAPGQIGAVIKLVDGRTATARFSLQGSGGSLELRGADNAALVSGALPTTVSAPPLFAN